MVISPEKSLEKYVKNENIYKHKFLVEKSLGFIFHRFM